MSGGRTVAGLAFLQGCEARLRALMASLRPLKPFPDILSSLAPSSRGIGWGGRATASCVPHALRLIEVKLSIPKRSKMGGAHGPGCAERLLRQAGSSPERERPAPAAGVRNF